MEKLMQYMWQHRLWQRGDLCTVDGEHLEILDPGLLNTNAGPDFFNAKIRIGDRTWAGNIELHIRASDWLRHGHDNDSAYNSIVLHVVAFNDARILRSDGAIIPQFVMTGVDDFAKKHQDITNNSSASLPCATQIASMPSIYITDWLTALAFERLYTKAERVEATLKLVNGDWRAALYVTLARAMGFSTNNDAFERLALAVPLRHMMHHQGSVISVEAMLFGQAGLLYGANANTPEEQYMNILRREYDFLATKYSLPTPKPLGWRMARMRPQTFPQRRIALLAAIIANGFAPANRIFSLNNLDEARSLFNVPVSTFWQRHYTFAHSEGANAGAVLGTSSIDMLIINAIVPVMYAFATVMGNNNLRELSADLLQQIPPERNNIVRLFESAGIVCRDAFTTQALIQLRRAYCETRKCLYCRIGHHCMAAKK